MSLAFWSTEIKKGKPAEVQPPEGYVLNVQLAAIASSPDKEVVGQIKAKTTNIDGEVITAVLCTLRSKLCDQTSLQLVFGFDVPVEFSVEGNATCVLSGYFQPGPESMDDSDDDMMYGDEDEEEDEDDIDAETYKRLVTDSSGKGDDDSNDDSDEDSGDESEDDSEEDGVDAAFIKKMIEKNKLKDSEQSSKAAEQSSKAAESGSDDDSEDGSDDDSEDDSDDVSDESPPPPPKKQQTPSGPKSKPNTPGTQGGKSKPNTPGSGFKGGGNKPQHQSGQKRKKA